MAQSAELVLNPSSLTPEPLLFTFALLAAAHRNQPAERKHDCSMRHMCLRYRRKPIIPAYMGGRGRKNSQGLPYLHNEFKASLRYMNTLSPKKMETGLEYFNII